MTVSNASLGLAPVAAAAKIDADELHRLCASLGLIADPINDRPGHYFAGERFLELINFLGCSPHIEFTAGDHGEHFTHVAFHRNDTPMLYHGAFSRPPFCPACNKPNKDWQQQADLAAQSLVCDHCGLDAGLADYDWRRSAGIASCLIEITEIYPKEALPQPALLDRLAEATGSEWGYFYF